MKPIIGFRNTLYISSLCALLTGAFAHAQSSVYTYYPGNDLDAFLTATGGTGDVTFNLTSGSGVPGLGSSFDVPLTFSNSNPSGLWDPTGAGPSGNTGGAYSLSQANATGEISFGAFSSTPGYDSEWQLIIFIFTSPNPPFTEDTLVYTGSDTPVAASTWEGTPDSFLYTEGSNVQSAMTSGFQVTFTPVPEPTTMLLVLSAGVLGILQRRRPTAFGVRQRTDASK